MTRERLDDLLPAGGILPLDEFLDRYLEIRAGQHFALVGPNGCGKTTVGMRILKMAHEMHPHTRGVALVSKPDKGPRSEGRRATGDRTVAALVKQHGAKITRSWPPVKPPWSEEPPYWAFWPRHSMDPEVDDEDHYWRFRDAILSSYKTGDTWVFGDEAYGLTKELGLHRELVTILSKGRSMNAGAILATQRPAYVPPSMFSEAKHLFLWKMSDGAIYERLRELGGTVDPKGIERILRRLRSKHECLYLYPEDNVMAVLT